MSVKKVKDLWKITDQNHMNYDIAYPAEFWQYKTTASFQREQNVKRCLGNIT